MAEFNRVNPNSRADAIGGMIKSAKSILESPLTEFIEGGQPMKTYWYHIDQNASYTGLGLKDTAGAYDGGIKYICIKDYQVLGYADDRPVDLEKGEHLDLRYKLDEMTIFHKPNTLRPEIGDLMSFELEQHQYLYKVTSSAPVTFNNKSFIKTIITKDSVKNANYYLQDFINDKLITRILEYDADAANYGNGNGIGNPIADPTRVGGVGDPNSTNNGGSKASPFRPIGSIDRIKDLLSLKNDLLDDFNSLYYMENKNIYVTPDKKNIGYLHYSPLIVDIQMEFRPLWTYGINTILTHETLVPRRSKYKNHNLRKFLKKNVKAWEKIKEEGLIFSGYQYMQNFYSPMYKIESYLNDSKDWYIYDYYRGDNVIYDQTGKEIMRVELKDTIKIPDRYIDIFDKYVNDTLESEELIDWLEDYEFDENFTDMLLTLVVLCIVDSTIYRLKQSNVSII